VNAHLPVPSAIAIVGSGMAGLAAGWLVARAGHRVVLYEAQARRGMDAHALRVDSPSGAGGIGLVDVPLRVMSPHAWQSVLSLCGEVGVDTFAVDTFASFTWLDGKTWLRNGAVRLGRRVVPFIDSARFVNLDAASVGFGLVRLATVGPIREGVTLGELAKEKHWPDTFFRAFLLPLLTTICTCDEATLLRWPARNLIDLFRQILFGKTLRRLVGGTPALVDGLVKGLEIRAPERVVAVTNDSTNGFKGVTVATASGTRDTFDAVFIATQANHVAGFLDASMVREREVLSRFRYDSGELVVHRDPRFMPPRRDDWTALNYLVHRDKSRSMFTVWVNPVEPSLTGAEPVFQTWNPLFAPAPDKVLAAVKLQRAVVDPETAKAHADLEALHAEPGRRVFFCGSFAAPGVPLLESAVRSAVTVASRVGIGAPWTAV
jgi:predicted NAD/FAD-binding protein